MNKKELNELLMRHASTFPTTIKATGTSSHMVIIPHELIQLWKYKSGDKVIVTIVKQEEEQPKK